MRRLLWFAVGFGAAAGLCCYYFRDWYLTLALWLLLAVGTCLLLGVYFRTPRYLGLILLGFCAGTLWFFLRDGAYLAQARALDETQDTYTLQATDYSSETDYGGKVTASIRVDGRSFPVLVYLNDDATVSPGDTLSGEFLLRFTSTGGSKSDSSYRAEGIFLLAYARGATEIVQADSVPAAYWPAQARHEIIARLQTLFDGNVFAFTEAVLLGETSDLDYETLSAFSACGLRHIVAVSGLHMGIVLACIYFLTARRRWLTLLVGVPTFFAFAAIVGFTPSVTRAAIMYSVLLLAECLNKEYDAPTSLAFAALCMLVLNPTVICSVSFQLSVCCVAGILAFAQPIRSGIIQSHLFAGAKGKGLLARLKRWFAGAMSVTLSANLLATTLVAYYFGAVSLIGPVCNLLLLWLIPVLFYGILLSIGLSFVWLPAARAAAFFTAIPIRIVLYAAKLLAKLPLAVGYTESVYIVAWIVIVYVLLAAFLLGSRRETVALLCCVLVLYCAAVGLSWYESAEDDFRLTVLDVGQGQCILVQSEGRHFLIDCGGTTDSGAADKAAETLLSQGISRLDGAILTHPDRDHCGGLAGLLSRVPADAVFLPQVEGIEEFAATLSGVEPTYVSSDMVLEYESTKIVLYYAEMVDSGNESSLCILLDTEKCDILITGDRTTFGEYLLMHRVELPQVDILIAGHHGSAYSTGEALLAQVQPKYVFISVGANNSYGMPAADTLARLESAGCIVYRTDLNGTIVYRG
ncbi:MAG: DNA internalization-related competence protein ComEC/Rec2 [Firmicutes bacterium]|nr:DNA internalization-related competence protein ComEC/Rec2 [Bacillota bacterium]